MKKIKISLLGKVILAIAAGILFGQVLPAGVVRLFVTFNSLFSEFLSFASSCIQYTYSLDYIYVPTMQAIALFAIVVPFHTVLSYVFGKPSDDDVEEKYTSSSEKNEEDEIELEEEDQHPKGFKFKPINLSNFSSDESIKEQEETPRKPEKQPSQRSTPTKDKNSEIQPPKERRHVVIEEPVDETHFVRQKKNKTKGPIQQKVSFSSSDDEQQQRRVYSFEENNYMLNSPFGRISNKNEISSSSDSEPYFYATSPRRQESNSPKEQNRSLFPEKQDSKERLLTTSSSQATSSNGTSDLSQEEIKQKSQEKSNSESEKEELKQKKKNIKRQEKQQIQLIEEKQSDETPKRRRKKHRSVFASNEAISGENQIEQITELLPDLPVEEDLMKPEKAKIRPPPSVVYQKWLEYPLGLIPNF